MARKRATDLSKTDMTMLVLIVLLVIFGLAVLFSSSEYNGRVRFGDSACYFKKQLFATALGMGVMYMVSSIDYHGTSGISDFNVFVRRSTFCRSGDQRLKKMAESWTFIFSAFRVCESCCNPFSCMADRAYKKSNHGLWIYVQDNIDPAADHWSCRFK